MSYITQGSTFIQDSSSNIQNHGIVDLSRNLSIIQYYNSTIQNSKVQQPFEERKESSLSSVKSNTASQLLTQAKDGDTAEVKRLLEMNPDMDICTITDQKQYTILHYSAFNSLEETSRIFLEKYDLDVDQGLKNFINQQTLDGFGAVHFAAYKGSLELLELFEQLGGNMMILNNSGMNIMHIAAQGDQPTVIAYACKLGIDIKQLDSKGGSPLHWSCYYGCDKSTLYLLSLIPDQYPYEPLNNPDKQNLTPLHLAVLSGNARVVKKLLIAGADRQIQGRDGTALEMAINQEYQNIASMLSQKESFLMRYYNLKQNFERRRKSVWQLSRFLFIIFYNYAVYFVLTYNHQDDNIIDQIKDTYFIILTSVFAFTLILYFMVVCKNPGYIHRNPGQLLQLLRSLEPQEICPMCQCIQLPRSKHCDVCQRCVMVYDHHCPWINNCVGANNHCIFIVFLVFTIISLILYLILLIKLMINESINSEKFIHFIFQSWLYKSLLIIFVAFYLIIDLLFFTALILLLFTQLKNMSYGKTTFEQFSYKNMQGSTLSQIGQINSEKASSISISNDGRSRSKSRYNQASYANLYDMCLVNHKQHRRQEKLKNQEVLLLQNQ